MGQLITGMEGKMFGRWLVLQDDAGRDKYGNKLCLCQCQCDAKTIKLVKGYDLRKGRSKSCGCKQKEYLSNMNFIDETNNKYGKLTVLYKTEKKGLNGQYYWMCKCDCGTKKFIRGDSLRNGSIISCGCYNSSLKNNTNKYYPGAKFGYLELIENTHQVDKHKYTIWKCKCWACGKEDVLISTKQLNQGKKSCCIFNSLGEKIICDLLNNNNITYIKEYINDKCRYPKTNSPARFDFYIPNYNYIIEFDDVQHFKEGNSYYDNPQKFKETQEHDQFKNQWCEDNHIPLIRIPYWHLDNLIIDDLLLERTEFLV